jgi:hypothetical protein
VTASVSGPGDIFDVSGALVVAGARVPAGAASGYVLTCDANGDLSLQPSAGGGSSGGQETLDNLGNITGAVTLAMASGSVFEGTLTGNVTFTFSGATAGSAWSFTLFLTQDGTGGRSVTLPGSVVPLGGVMPVIGSAPGALTVLVFETLNAGTTWYASLAGNDPSLPQTVSDGGTGMGSLTAYALLAGGLTATGAVQQVAALGTAGQPLVSAGPGTLPVFGGPVAPTVTALADAAPTAVNAALGNYFTWLLGASRTLSAPSNPTSGQYIELQIQQPASGGPYTVTWTSGAAGYSFGTDGAPVLSTAASAVDQVGFRYSALLGKWCCQGWKLGFS